MRKGKREIYGSRLRFAWIPVWVLFLLLSVLMFCNQGRYIHTLQVELIPTAREFQMKVLVDGKNIKVSYNEPHLFIISEKMFTGNQTEIVIKGEWDREPVYDEEAEKAVQLQLSFHNDSPESNWQLKAGGGADSVQADYSDTVHVGRYSHLLVLLSVGITQLLIIWRKARRKKDIIRKILDEVLQDESCEEAFEAGKHWFLVHNRRKNLSVAFILWPLLGKIMVDLQNIFSSMEYRFIDGWWKKYVLFYVLLFLIELLLNFYHGKKFNEMLLKEQRPLTAAVAYMMDALQNGASCLSHKTAIHNAAVGLCRAGKYEMALQLAEQNWKGEKEGEFVQYCHSNLRYLCFRNLGKPEEAKQEEAKQRQILQARPRLKKNKGVFFQTQAVKIWDALEHSGREQAAAYTNVSLEQCEDPYYRIPFLSIQAMLAEDMAQSTLAEQSYEELLQYSLENAAVRKALHHSPCCYRESGDLYKDTVLKIMYGILGVIGVLFLLILIAVSPVISIREERSQSIPIISVQETAGDSEILPSPKKSEMLEFSVPEDGIQNGEKGQEQPEQERTDEVSNQAPAYSLTLPETWENRVIEKKSRTGGRGFYQKSSYERMETVFCFI